MEVVFRIQNFAPNEVVYRFASDLIERAMAEVGCPADGIIKTIVADEGNYGPAIRSVSPSEGYTNSNGRIGGGKAILVKREGLLDSSVIVLRDFVMDGVAGCFQKNFGQRSCQEQEYVYAIWHEVGHARDHRERPIGEDGPDRVVDPAGRFKIAHVASYYAPIVLGEIHACRFSAFTYRQDIADRQEQDDIAHMVQRLLGLKEMIRLLDDGQGDVRKMAIWAAETFWLPFYTYGKAIAHMIGNDRLDRCLKLWPGAAPGADALVGDYVKLLHGVFVSYPNTPNDYPENLSKLWSRLAAMHGFSFVENPIGDDRLLWKDPIWPTS